MIGVTISQTLKMAAEAFRLGMEAAGSEALARATELLEAKISGWSEQELRSLNLLLEELFEAQSSKNFLFAADILEYQVLPIFAVPTKGEEGDQG